MFSRPRPISIAPNAPAADGNSSRARITIVTASTGPMNAAHGMGEAAVLSSASNSCMYGSAPTAATRPATNPTAPKRSSKLGPARRVSTSPAASRATASAGARTRLENGRAAGAAACSTTSASRMRIATSSVGATAIAVMPASPARPKPSKRDRSALSGAKTTTSASDAAATMSIARAGADSDRETPSASETRPGVLRTMAASPPSPRRAPMMTARFGRGRSTAAQAAPAAGSATASSGSNSLGR